MSKPWGLGTWAADAERAEAEEKEQAASPAAAAVATATSGDSQSFPSLRDAVTTKHKKKTKMSLQEFAMQGGLGSGGSASRDSGFSSQGLTPDEMLRLPTGPKERSPEEMQSRLGGGFSSYGRSTGGPPGRMRDRNGDGGGDTSWGNNRRSHGGFDDDTRAPPPRVSDHDQPSRADEVDNWAMGKKSSPSLDTSRSNRYSSLGGGGMSKADESDNWGAGKKPLPSRSSTFGTGFRDSGPEPNRWGREGLRERGEERPRLVLDRRSSDVGVIETAKSNKPNPFGGARPREEILAEKGLDWKKMDMEIEVKKSSRPTSSESSRPGSSETGVQQGAIEGAVKPRPKVNPFGEAKPREVLLEEKGLDWRKIDLNLEHRRIEMAVTEGGENSKEEIEHPKEEELEKEAVEGSGEEEHSSLKARLLGQKGIERPGSSAEFTETRGSGDMWDRHGGDGRTSFNRGFLGNRDLGRFNSGEKW